MQKSLPRSTPEAEGVSSPDILAFVNAAEKKEIGLHSLMVVRHGKVVAEGWWEPYGAEFRHVLFSLSKSFTSTAAGLAASEGFFSLDDKVISFFPDQAPANPSKNLAAMRVRDLLCMGTGHDKDTVTGLDRQKDDWVSSFLEQPVEHEPGTHFLYNSGATYMVSAIVQKTTGQKVIDFLTPRLFEPLGIENPVWEVCPRGINTGGWGLSVRTEDIAKFGLLYRQDGIWEGKRLLPEGWVADASAKHISNGTDPNNDWAQGYGYQFWRTRHGLYRGDGAFGQYCIVMPKQDAVIAVTSGSSDMGGIMNLMWDHLLPAMKEGTLSEDSAAHEKLVRKLGSLVMPFPEGKPSSRLAAEVSGYTYTFPENDQTIESASLTLGADVAEITFRNSCGDQKITAGFGKWIRGETRLTTPHPLKVAASYAWPREDTFELRICHYETPTIMTTTCRYAGDEVTCNSKINVSFGPTEKPALKGKRA